MSEPKVDDVLDFLNVWKTRHQVEVEFEMTNSSSYHFLRWLEKGNYITKKKLNLDKCTNKRWFYKRCDDGKD